MRVRLQVQSQFNIVKRLQMLRDRRYHDLKSAVDILLWYLAHFHYEKHAHTLKQYIHVFLGWHSMSDV